MKKNASDMKQVAPAGVASGVLFPETRSGVGSKTTKSNGAETPFPDQGTGATTECAWNNAGEPLLWDTGCGKKLSLVNWSPKSHPGRDCPGCARPIVVAPRPQSGADEGESCSGCNGVGLHFYPNLRTEKCPHCLGTGSRKERSVSGNADGLGRRTLDADSK